MITPRTTTTVTLRATWSGPPPTPGEFVMSQVRARFAYRIEDVRPAGSTLELVCTRLSPRDVPVGSTVHDWKWNPRSKKRAVRAG